MKKVTGKKEVFVRKQTANLEKKELGWFDLVKPLSF